MVRAAEKSALPDAPLNSNDQWPRTSHGPLTLAGVKSLSTPRNFILFGGWAKALVLTVSSRTATMRIAQGKAFTFMMNYLQNFEIHAFIAEIPRPAGQVRTCARDVLLQNFLSAVKMCAP